MLALFPDVSAGPSVSIAGKDAGTSSRRSALDVLRGAPLTPKGQGSNNWVVAGSRSVTGKPLLANDPHLLAQVPSIWFECHLSAPEYEASGVALPFSPGIVIGHTAHHAWGMTNVGGDVLDLYLERLNEDRTAALHNGRWEPVTVHREEIRVRGRDEPEVLEVVETRHGPVIDSYMIGIGAPEVVRGGSTVPVPGWNDDYEADGFIPFEDLPWSENPEEGFLATANNKIHDDSYPHLITRDFFPPYRVRRIVQMITETDRHSADSFARMQTDTVSLPARHILPFLLEVEPADDRQKEALAHLAEWDGDLSVDSVAACIYEVWGHGIAWTILLPKLGPELFQHFYGRRQWTN